MTDRPYLSRPLYIDEGEILGHLENHPLYPEFHGRIDDALELIHRGQGHWQEHRTDDGEWSESAMRAVTEIRLRAYNIHQAIMFSKGDGEALVSVIQSRADLCSTEISDAQCIAALAMDRSCRAIEALWRWFAELEDEWRQANPELLEAIQQQDPEGFAELVTEARQETPQLEIETRERIADLLGTARHYMTLADISASSLSPEAKAEIIRAAILGAEETIGRAAIKEKAREVARAGGLGSRQAKREQFSEDAAATCKAARQKMKGNKLSPTELVGQLLEQGGHGTRPTIIARLRTEGLYPPPKERKKAD